MFPSPRSRRTPSVRRQLFAVVATFCLLIQQSVLIVSATQLSARGRAVAQGGEATLPSDATPTPLFANPTTTVFINEFHYDDAGGDANEFVEVAAPAGTNMANYSIVLYNGANGTVYDTDALSGTTTNQSGGYGFVSILYATDGVQNGSPDGIALVDTAPNPDVLVQFLCYEGTFTATNGPANGVMCTDIGVSENGSGAEGASLQLQGTGTTYGNFTWAVTNTTNSNTRNAVNTGQTFTGGGGTSTNPSGMGAANPSAVTAGNSTLLTVTVTPGTNPTSTGLTVTANLSSIGGSATQQFFDNGTNGDVTAGDNVFSFQATVAANTAPGMKTLPVTITDAQMRTGNTSISLTVNPAPGMCGGSFTPIYNIQGSGTASPIASGTTVNTEGVVTADFQAANQQSGFYIQDPSGDGNTATSDGIFVFSSSPDVSVGDRVRVTGQVTEFNTMTEINNVTSTQVCSTGNTVPPPTVFVLPELFLNDLERVEGMLVTFQQTLTVTGNNLQGRFGEVMLAAGGRLFQQNSFDRPNSSGALNRDDLNDRSQILLDDAMNIQNPNPIPYIGADNTLRAGDTVTNPTGVIDYGLSTTNATTRDYRLQPTVTPTFVRANPRPAAPAPVGGNLKVASSNVLNYFNGDGMGGGFPTERGASTPAEFARQRAKIIAALTTMNADVLGIIEMENDGGGPQSALQDLVNGMNDATAPGTYAGLHSPNPGTDAIQNAIIYKPASVTLVGSQTNDINPAWDQARPPLAQTFQHNGNGEKFTFIVNHFTSKGCSASDTGIDADMGDGQGCDNGQRKLQANRLLVFIQDRKMASDDPDVLSMGDYNAYGEEDPNFILEQDSGDTLMDGAGGLVSQTKRFVPMLDRYSFQFDATFGELDHAFATKSMNNQVSGTTIWHINADEPTVIDYNQEFKTQDLYTPTPYRASDHDPLVVGLNLTSAAPQAPGTVIISEFRFRGPGPDVVGADPDGVSIGDGGYQTLGPRRGQATSAPGAALPPQATATPSTAPANNDEFIEFYNNTESEINVQTVDGSAGWALVASDGTTRFVIPNGTKIPPRGHYLAANSLGYSLTNYPGGYDGTTEKFAIPDIQYSLDIEDQSGIALFNTANAANFDEAHRLDAVGYDSAPALYREGGGFPTASAGVEVFFNIEYSFFRDIRNDFPKDTQNNVADFQSADTLANRTTIGEQLGAPGPENRFSPALRLGVHVNRFDSAVNVNSSPNRVRRTCSDSMVEECDSTRSSLGTLSSRRNVVNNTGGFVTRLRFRIKEITTLPPPPGTADIRALSSNDIMVMRSDGQTIPVHGTTLETPPDQPLGGGWNTSLTLGTVSLESPLAPGESVNVQFLFGVQQGGTFRVFINVEALP